MVKKNLLITCLILSSILVSGESIGVHAEEVDDPLVVGVRDTPQKIDPVDVYDKVSINTMIQVCEGLYQSDYASPDLKPIPRLAAAMGTWNGEKTELTIPLREDVFFHDGLLFRST